MNGEAHTNLSFLCQRCCTVSLSPSGALIAVVALGLATLLAIIALFLTPRYLAAFNVTTIVAIVLMATNFVFARFDKTDTMRPWEQALEQIVPTGEVVFMYKPSRWMEYGMQFYRYNNAKGVGSPEELSQLTADRDRLLCIAEDKSLDELTRHGNLEIKVVHTIGHQTAFWVWRTPGS